LQGKLTKNLGHLAVSFTHPKPSLIKIELHHGSRKSVATLRTVRTLIVRRTTRLPGEQN
jgi:large subunit ribosomal protein L9e